MIELAFLFAAAGVGAIGLAGVLAKRHERRLDDAWREVARQIDGDFWPRERDDRSIVHRRVTGVIDGVAVVVAHRTEDLEAKRRRLGLDAMQASYMGPPITTAAEADTSAPGFALLAERSAFVTMGEAWGRVAVHLEDDFPYGVRSSDPVRARVWLSPRVRRGLVAVRDWSFRIEEDVVHAERPGVEEDAATIQRVLRVLVLLARRGEDAMAEWRALAKALGGEVAPARRAWDTDTALVVVRRGVEARVALASAEEGIVTRITAPAIAPVGTSKELQTPRGLVVAAFEVGALVRLDLAGVVLDPADLERAIDAILDVAVASATTPYR